MTTFDDRERGFESKHARDEETEFKAAARRNRQLGRWAGEQLGLSGPELDAYVTAVMRSDLQDKGDEDVLRKVSADLSAKGVNVSATDLRARMDHLLVAAREELYAGR